MIKFIELETYGWAVEPDHPEKYVGIKLKFKVPRSWLIKKLTINRLKEFREWIKEYAFDDSLIIYNLAIKEKIIK